MEAHPVPSHPLPHKGVKNLGDFIGNSIGGAFYDADHDLVVSYKVKLIDKLIVKCPIFLSISLLMGMLAKQIFISIIINHI